mmetsp:Transcript_36897/g.75211  ORF Transcript_36897/g.75211 Transcript_36897/m.75211 type:complete len:468 (+) Transcript_36897:286-1689(+)
MGKKSRKTSSSKNLSNSDRKNPAVLGSVVTTVAQYLKLAEEEKLPLERYFSRHRHSVSSCDGDGAFNLISLFVLNPRLMLPGTPERSVITTVCMRVHDNIRSTMILPNDAFQNGMLQKLPLVEDIGPGKTMDEYYDAFVQNIQNSTGTGFRKAPYAHCKKLVNDCLLRMKTKKKVLVGKEERTVVRLFGLESEEHFHQQQIQLPRPAPAPDVDTLWLVLNRPEHYFFHVSSDLHDLFGFECGEVVIDHEYFERSLDYILEDEYRQERLPAMLNHAANWHMLEGSEEEVASWLLWERQPMMLHPVGHPNTVDAMRNSVILQLMINKFFNGQTGELLMHTFPAMNLYGSGITNFLFYTRHLSITGRLPPAFIVKASVAEGVDGASISDSGNASAENVEGDVSTNLERTMRKLTIRKTSCAVCGATRSPTGTRLLVCSRCESVAYCCAEHQKIHWKSGGHKQQCTLDLLG